MKKLATICLTVLLVAPAGGAEFPSRPIRVIVANVPGSGVDVLTRIVTVRLGTELGQHIVVEYRIDSRPGAGTAYGMEIGRKAMPDGYTLMSGESQWTITPAPSVWPLAQAGRLRALGHSLPKRTPLLGDLPAVAETIPGYDYSGWFTLIAPRGTPKLVLEKLRGALHTVLARADVAAAFAEQASVIAGNTPAEFRRLILSEQAKYAEVVKAAGLKPDQ